MYWLRLQTVLALDKRKREGGMESGGEYPC